MQIMDTNISLLDKINEYEWDYLNGYCDSKIIDNLNKNFADYSDHIKVNNDITTKIKTPKLKLNFSISLG